MSFEGEAQIVCSGSVTQPLMNEETHITADLFLADKHIHNYSYKSEVAEGLFH